MLSSLFCFVQVWAFIIKVESEAAMSPHNLKGCTCPRAQFFSDVLRNALVPVTVRNRQNDHVHPPEDAHDPADHDDGGEDLDESGRHVQPKHAALPPLRNQVAASPTQHRERRDESA